MNLLRPDFVFVKAARSIPITIDNLPNGPHWDEDGACFTAERCDPKTVGVEWRWAARNTMALKKGEPDKPLFDFAPLCPTGIKAREEDGEGG